MYNLTEFMGQKKPTQKICSATPRIIFSIYYKVPDNAFKNAAAIWKNRIIQQEFFLGNQDYFFEREISSETEFRTAWRELHGLATRGNYEVLVGNILSHASKQTDDNDGLEFKKDLGNDGTLREAEIRSLAKLPWSKNGYLILCGCNTGLQKERSWVPAKSFAKSQGIPTLGQTGYAYFSTQWGIYKENSKKSANICLWAYSRGQNDTFGSGARMLGKIYQP